MEEDEESGGKKGERKHVRHEETTVCFHVTCFSENSLPGLGPECESDGKDLWGHSWALALAIDSTRRILF